MPTTSNASTSRTTSLTFLCGACVAVAVAVAMTGCASNDSDDPYVPSDAGPTVAAPAPASFGYEVGGSCEQRGVVHCSTTSPANAIQCNGSTYVPYFACPGLETCAEIAGLSEIGCGLAPATSEATSTHLTYFAKEGDPCAEAEAPACTFERTAILICIDGVWTEGVHCPPSECTTVDNVVQCANGGVTLGDVCRESMAGSVMCSTDLKAILTCASGKMEMAQGCGAGFCARVGEDTLDCR